MHHKETNKVQFDVLYCSEMRIRSNFLFHPRDTEDLAGRKSAEAVSLSVIFIQFLTSS